MRFLRWFLLFSLLLSVPVLSSAGDVQILCEPGLRVYLDGKVAGTSSTKEDGLFLPGVAVGGHVIRVEKDGFAPQSFKVEVEKLPIEVKVGAFSPLPPASPEKAPAPPAEVPMAGRLTVTSAPQNCTFEVDGKPEAKDVPVLRVDALPPGPHTVAFSKPGFERLTGVVNVPPGGEISVRGDLLAGKLETEATGKGSLRVFSTPEICSVQILGKTHDKTASVLNVTHLPAGEHRMVVTWRGRQMAGNVLITAGRRTVVTVSFIRGDEPFVVSYEPE
jgi:PEGA domain